MRYVSLPAPSIIFTPLLYLHQGVVVLLVFIKKIILFFYWQPLFAQYLEKPPKFLNLCNKMPMILGNPRIRIGEFCTINGGIEIIARTQEQKTSLSIGNRVFIGHNVRLYVGNAIEIGDHCLIADGCVLRGYSGHPLDPAARKANLPDVIAPQSKIVLESNVWLGQNVTVNKGVRIGENSVIASGSVVTKDIPANVLAGGMPAKVIRMLEDNKHA